MSTNPPPSTSQPVLSARNVTKRYGGVTALVDGSLEVSSGEVVVLVGANGSGKSTLNKIITGVVGADGGDILLDGKPITLTSPHAARRLGIIAVYQELSLIPDMTVEENIWLTHEPLRGPIVQRKAVRRRTQELLALFADVTGAALVPDAPIRTLPPDERQIVEICKAISIQPRVLILDEATASLDSRQVNRLFELVRKWQGEGTAIVFVSHRMEEVFRIGNRAVVLRNGSTVGDSPMTEATESMLVRMMVGKSAPDLATALEVSAAAPLPAAAVEVGSDVRPGDVRVQARNLRTSVLRGVDLDVRDGELVGLGGLRGQGQEDLLMAIFGALPSEGTIRLAGEQVHFRHPREAMHKGVAYVPGERNRQGLLAFRSILENLQLPSWMQYGTPLRMTRAYADAGQIAQELQLVMAGLDAPVSSLSGGNAQKVVLGKWLLRRPTLLLLNDPTKGVDVSAKEEIYRLLRGLRQRGAAILLYSSDDDELLALCDRILVLHDGLVRATLAGETLMKERLIAASMGAAHDETEHVSPNRAPDASDANQDNTR